MQCGKRHFVIVGDDRGRRDRAPKQFVDHPRGNIELKVAIANQPFRGVRIGQRLAEARKPARRIAVIGRARDIRQMAMAELEQMPRRCGGRAFFIHMHIDAATTGSMTDTSARNCAFG